MLGKVFDEAFVEIEIATNTSNVFDSFVAIDGSYRVNFFCFAVLKHEFFVLEHDLFK